MINYACRVEYGLPKMYRVTEGLGTCPRCEKTTANSVTEILHPEFQRSSWKLRLNPLYQAPAIESPQSEVIFEIHTSSRSHYLLPLDAKNSTTALQEGFEEKRRFLASYIHASDQAHEGNGSKGRDTRPNGKQSRTLRDNKRTTPRIVENSTWFISQRNNKLAHYAHSPRTKRIFLKLFQNSPAVCESALSQ